MKKTQTVPTTPPVVSEKGVSAPLTPTQRRIVEKMIRLRYDALIRVAEAAPRPSTTKVPNTWWVDRFIDESEDDCPREMRDLIEKVKDAGLKLKRLVADAERASAEVLRQHSTAQRTLICRLTTERDGLIAKLHLDTAGNEVGEYLKGLPSVETLLGDLHALGMTTSAASEQLLLAQEQQEQLARRKR